MYAYNRVASKCSNLLQQVLKGVDFDDKQEIIKKWNRWYLLWGNTALNCARENMWFHREMNSIFYVEADIKPAKIKDDRVGYLFWRYIYLFYLLGIHFLHLTISLIISSLNNTLACYFALVPSIRSWQLSCWKKAWWETC